MRGVVRQNCPRGVFARGRSPRMYECSAYGPRLTGLFLSLFRFISLFLHRKDGRARDLQQTVVATRVRARYLSRLRTARTSGNVAVGDVFAVDPRSPPPPPLNRVIVAIVAVFVADVAALFIAVFVADVVVVGAIAIATSRIFSR